MVFPLPEQCVESWYFATAQLTHSPTGPPDPPDPGSSPSSTSQYSPATQAEQRASSHIRHRLQIKMS